MIHLKELKSYAKTAKQEWLVTNGVGGYAAGTVAGALTRRYHGLLIAALNPPTERTLLVAKLDTVARFNEMTVPLYANVWGGGLVEALNLPYLIDFKLEGTTPIWTYQRAGLRLQKRIWMEQGANTTYIRYDVLDAPEPVQLSMRALVNYRNHHGETRAEGWRMKVTNLADGIRVVPYDTAVPFTIRSTGAKTTVENEWYYNFDLGVERYRGLPDNEDHLLAATFTAVVEPGSTLTMVASTDKDPDLDGEAAYARRREYEQSLLDASPFAEPPLGIEQLTLAADQFIVRRPIPSDPQGLTVIAGYPWFNDWGRDTMIALPGLTLATGRSEIAARILRTFARFVDQGMLPNQFPDEGTQPEYNTVDATLWYFQAIRAYHAAAGDDQLIKDLFPVLVDILEWHIKGTRYNIHMDEVDSLLFAGEQGTQLTWMDAKVGEWVVTPRTGKSVEINALWYNAFTAMALFAEVAGEDPTPYTDRAGRIAASFARFWSDEHGYLYDVIDVPGSDEPDASLRPNQLFAVSLPDSPLTPAQCRAVVDVCAEHLLTPRGLRTLAPDDANYEPQYGGTRLERDGAYHQGTVWSWLIGPFASAHLRVYEDKAAARATIEPLFDHLYEGGLGQVSEIFDADAPYTARGCFAQAWGVSEILRVWWQTNA